MCEIEVKNLQEEIYKLKLHITELLDRLQKSSCDYYALLKEHHDLIDLRTK